MLGFYKQSWASGGNGYTLEFHLDPATGASHANAEWDLDTFLDWGNYTPRGPRPIPMLLYSVAGIIATNYNWNATLIVTS